MHDNPYQSRMILRLIKDINTNKVKNLNAVKYLVFWLINWTITHSANQPSTKAASSRCTYCRPCFFSKISHAVLVKSCVMCHISCVIFHVSCVMFHAKNNYVLDEVEIRLTPQKLRNCIPHVFEVLSSQNRVELLPDRHR